MARSTPVKMIGSLSKAVYLCYLIFPLLSVDHAVSITTTTTAAPTAEQCFCLTAGKLVCAPGYTGQLCEITTASTTTTISANTTSAAPTTAEQLFENTTAPTVTTKDATDYLSSVAVDITPNSMYLPLDFSISGTGEIAVSYMKYDFNANGKTITILNESLNLTRRFEVKNEVTCLTYGSNEVLYLSGSSNVVYVYNNTGGYLSEFPTHAEKTVTSIVGAEGLLYLTFEDLQKVLIYNEDGTPEASIEQGLDGQPAYVTVTEDKIYVTSSTSYSIYFKNYTHIRTLPFNEPPLEIEEMSGGGVGVDDFGNMLVPDYDNDRLIVLDANYELVGTFGEEGSGLGQFYSPLAVKFSPDFRYFIVLEDNKGLQRFEISSSA